MHISGSAARLDETLCYKGKTTVGSSLLVTVLCGRHLGTLNSIRVTKRLADSAFPFLYASVLDAQRNTIYHYRFLPPRLTQDLHGGVLYEIWSKRADFTALKVAGLEFQRRLKKDHLWMGAAGEQSSLHTRIEVLSTAVTTALVLSASCAIGHTFFGGAAADMHGWARPFRATTRDLLMGLWTAVFVTPLSTLILQILNQYHARSGTEKDVDLR